MTSSDRQADATSPKRKRKTSSDKRIKPKRRKHVASNDQQSVSSVNTQLLELKQVTSSGDRDLPKHHEIVEKQMASCDSHSAGESSGNLNTSFQT
jgi:hypothetical protein